MPKSDNNKKDITQDKGFLAKLTESKDTILYGPFTMTANFSDNRKPIATLLVLNHLLRGVSLASVHGRQKSV